MYAKNKYGRQVFFFFLPKKQTIPYKYSTYLLKIKRKHQTDSP